MSEGKVHSVLIVEDERIVAKDLQETLAEMGYDAFAIASSADEAVSRASERCPDLVLMDIRIKGKLDGIEAATLLRDRFGVPVVFLTAHADEATIQRAKKAEPYGYLLKPVKAAELRSAIEVSIHKHEMERRLRSRERRSSTTPRSVGDAVVTVDLAGHITFMNSAAETLTGVSASEAMGRPVREVVRPLDPEHPAPLDIPVAAPMVDDGQMLGTVMVFRDTTEHRLRDKQLELADRLASLSTMAAGIAHQINNPLTVVVANASYVIDQLRRQPRGEGADPLAEPIQALAELEAAAARIARVVADLHAFWRPAKTAAGEAELGPAAEGAVQSTALEYRDRATVVTSIETPTRVKVDEARLREILISLLTNAAHAIEPGHLADNTVTIKAHDRGDNVVIEVRDTGCGIAPELLSRVFEPFYTTKPAGFGTGLGLAVCDGMVRSVGGRLDVESQVGEGTTFTVTLPAVLRPGAKIVSSPPSSAVQRRGRILAIDDEPTVLRALARLLREHDVVCVDDAHQALERLDHGEHFDVILTDMMMPRMTGMAFYERLLEGHPEVAHRVVFLTDATMNARVADFLSVVPNVSLDKPTYVYALRALVHEVLAEQDDRV